MTDDVEVDDERADGGADQGTHREQSDAQHDNQQDDQHGAQAGQGEKSDEKPREKQEERRGSGDEALAIAAALILGAHYGRRGRRGGWLPPVGTPRDTPVRTSRGDGWWCW